MRRGIHPVITVIIIVAITIAIALAAAGWIMGLFTSEQSQVSEGISFYPDSYFNSTNATVYLHMKVHLKPMVEITDIRVSGANVTGKWIETVYKGQAWVSNGSVYAKVGTDFVLGISIDKHFSPGTEVKVQVFTSTGYVYWTTVESK